MSRGEYNKCPSVGDDRDSSVKPNSGTLNSPSTFFFHFLLSIFIISSSLSFPSQIAIIATTSFVFELLPHRNSLFIFITFYFSCRPSIYNSNQYSSCQSYQGDHISTAIYTITAYLYQKENMAAALKLFKLGLEHRGEIQGAYAKHGTDLRAHRNDAMGQGYDAACSAGTSVATAPLRAAENIPRLVVRGLQFLFGLVMVGIYGVRVGAGSRDPAEAAAATWWFGLAVAVAACASALFLAFTAPLGLVCKKLRTHHMFGLDLLLCLMWFVAFGIFFGIFHHRDDDDSYKGSSTAVQRRVTWLDLVNALFWLLSGVYGFVKSWVGRKRDAVLSQGRERMQDRLAYKGGLEAGVDSDKEEVDYSTLSEPDQVYQQGRARPYFRHV